MKEERDRFLTEAMGECWHEYDLGKPVLTCKGGGFICGKCRDFVVSNNDFSTREDFAKLSTWAEGQIGVHRDFAPFRTALSGPTGQETRDRAADVLYRLLLSREK
ncbi:MAG: hypothetical protein ABSC19_12155 [Syntrophorhabdales bacterium]|jgi:hypothetical protein